MIHTFIIRSAVRKHEAGFYSNGVRGVQELCHLDDVIHEVLHLCARRAAEIVCGVPDLDGHALLAGR